MMYLSDKLFARLSKDNKHLEFLNEFDKEIESNSDRGLVLICGSILDDILKDLLESYLVENNKSDKEIFNFGKPLGNLDAKITMSFYLGLITENERSNLSFIRNLRNRFAHEIFDVSFTHNTIENICSNLYIPKNAYVPKNIPLMKDDSEELPFVDLNPIKKETPVKNKFIFVFRYLYMNLINRTFHESLGRRDEYTKVYKAHETIELINNKMNNMFDDMKKIIEEKKALELKEIALLVELEEENNAEEKMDFNERRKNIHDEYESEMKRIEETKKEYEPLISINNYTYDVLKKSLEK